MPAKHALPVRPGAAIAAVSHGSSVGIERLSHWPGLATKMEDRDGREI